MSLATIMLEQFAVARRIFEDGQELSRPLIVSRSALFFGIQALDQILPPLWNRLALKAIQAFMECRTDPIQKARFLSMSDIGHKGQPAFALEVPATFKDRRGERLLWPGPHDP